MIVMLDSHALVWWLDGSSSLSTPARRTIEDPANETVVSAATVWELSIKQELGRLRIDADLPGAIEAAGFIGLPITVEDGAAAGALPPHHRDPFDRMLIAQARRIDAVVVTRDRAFSAYDIQILTA